MKTFFRLALFISFSVFSGCTIQAPTPTQPIGASPTPAAPGQSPVGQGPTPAPDSQEIPAPSAQRLALSWEIPSNPERRAWSDRMSALSLQYLPTFSRASDLKDFCPKFANLSQDKKVKAISELVIGIFYFESSYSPVSWMRETKMSIDKITGVQIASEGLGQLSYQDTRNYPHIASCQKISWAIDKPLDAISHRNPAKTIMNPITNIECSMDILAQLTASDGMIAGYEPKRGGAKYWSVLWPQTHHQAIIERLKTRTIGCF